MRYFTQISVAVVLCLLISVLNVTQAQCAGNCTNRGQKNGTGKGWSPKNGSGMGWRDQGAKVKEHGHGHGGINLVQR